MARKYRIRSFYYRNLKDPNIIQWVVSKPNMGIAPLCNPGTIPLSDMLGNDVPTIFKQATVNFTIPTASR